MIRRWVYQSRDIHALSDLLTGVTLVSTSINTIISHWKVYHLVLTVLVFILSPLKCSATNFIFGKFPLQILTSPLGLNLIRERSAETGLRSQEEPHELYIFDYIVVAGITDYQNCQRTSAASGDHTPKVRSLRRYSRRRKGSHTSLSFVNKRFPGEDICRGWNEI